MNFRHPETLVLILALALSPLALLSPRALAAGAAKAPPLELKADHAVLDQRAGTAVYEGHAVLTQGNRELRADHIEVFSSNGTVTRVEANGSPATMQEGDSLQAHANKLIYNVQAQMLRLSGDAFIRHQGKTFESADIQYNLQSKQVNAQGKDGQRVKIVIPGSALPPSITGAGKPAAKKPGAGQPANTGRAPTAAPEKSPPTDTAPAPASAGAPTPGTTPGTTTTMPTPAPTQPAETQP